jgi:hypothetical protein
MRQRSRQRERPDRSVGTTEQTERLVQVAGPSTGVSLSALGQAVSTRPARLAVSTRPARLAAERPARRLAGRQVVAPRTMLATSQAQRQP